MHANEATPAPRPRGRLEEVSSEIGALASRRRAMIATLGAFYAVMSVYLDRVVVIDDPGLTSLFVDTVFLYFLAFAVMNVILSLRFGQMQYGWAFNGFRYEAGIPEGDVERAKRFNWTGVTFVHFLMCALSAAIGAWGCAFEFGRASDWTMTASSIAAAVLAVAVLLWLCLDIRLKHSRGWAAAAKRPPDAAPQNVDLFRRDHALRSIEESHQDMHAILGSAMLIVFSLFQTRAFLAQESATANAIAVPHSALGYSIVAWSLLALSMVAYIRLCRAITYWSRMLDPDDPGLGKPGLHDALFGYVFLSLLAVVNAVAIAWAIVVDEFDRTQDFEMILWLVGIVMGILCGLAYRFFVVRYRPTPQPIPVSTSESA